MDGLNKLVVNDETLHEMLAHYLNTQVFGQHVDQVRVTATERNIMSPSAPTTSITFCPAEDE